MVTHSSTLAWEIPWKEGAWWAAVHGVAKSRTQLSDFTFTHWRRKCQPTPVFLPGEFQGRRSLVGCCLWGRTESDTTEVTQQQQQQQQEHFRMEMWHPQAYPLANLHESPEPLKSFLKKQNKNAQIQKDLIFLYVLIQQLLNRRREAGSDYG